MSSIVDVLIGLADLAYTVISGIFDLLIGIFQLLDTVLVALSWISSIFPVSWVSLFSAFLSLAFYMALWPYFVKIVDWIIQVLVPKVP